MHYKKSVALYSYVANIFNTAVVYAALGEKDEARKYFFKILDAKDHSRETYSRALSLTAWELLQLDSPGSAKEFIKQALQKDHSNPYLWAHYAISNYRLHNKNEAVIAAVKAQRLSSKEEFNQLYYLISNDKTVPPDLNIISQ